MNITISTIWKNIKKSLWSLVLPPIAQIANICNIEISECCNEDEIHENTFI